jgi:hypothetical protein
MKAAQMAAIEHGTGNVYRVGCDIERELNAAQQRIKRLEEAGDAMFPWSERVGQEFWTKAKEDKL